MSNALGEVLRLARSAAGFTQQTLADMLGVSRSAIGQWEAGTHEPSTENLIAVCKALGVEVDGAVNGVLRSSKDATSAGDAATESMSAKNSFDLIGGLGTAFIKSRYPDLKNPIDVHVCHFIPEKTETFISVKPFTKYLRPAALRDKESAYGIILADNYLWPKYEQNEILYIDASSHAQIGDYVALRTKRFATITHPTGGEGIETEICVLGRLLGFELFGVRLQQHTLAREVTVDIGDAGVLHRVCPAIELILMSR